MTRQHPTHDLLLGVDIDRSLHSKVAAHDDSPPSLRSVVHRHRSRLASNIIHMYTFSATCPHTVYTTLGIASLQYITNTSTLKSTHTSRLPRTSKYASAHAITTHMVTAWRMERCPQLQRRGMPTHVTPQVSWNEILTPPPPEKVAAFGVRPKHSPSQKANDHPKYGFGLQLHHLHKDTATAGLGAIASSSGSTACDPIPLARDLAGSALPDAAFHLAREGAAHDQRATASPRPVRGGVGQQPPQAP